MMIAEYLPFTEVKSTQKPTITGREERSEPVLRAGFVVARHSRSSKQVAPDRPLDERMRIIVDRYFSPAP